MVEQYCRHPMGAQWLSHHRIQHRRGEHRPDQHPASQVGDLGAPFFGLGGFNFRGSRLADAARWCVTHSGLWLFRFGGSSGLAVGGDDECAVDHVHAARKSERTRLLWGEPHGGALMRGQRRRQMKVGKDHPRAAIPGFLPVEFDLHRNALAHFYDVGAVSTADRYLDPLHPVADRGGVGAAGGKEVPRQPGDRQGRACQDGNVNAGHHELLCGVD